MSQRGRRGIYKARTVPLVVSVRVSWSEAGRRSAAAGGAGVWSGTNDMLTRSAANDRSAMVAPATTASGEDAKGGTTLHAPKKLSSILTILEAGKHRDRLQRVV